MKKPKEKQKAIKFNKLQLTLIVCTIFLVLFGILMVYSASYYYAKKTYNNPYFFFNKAIYWFCSWINSYVFIIKS